MSNPVNNTDKVFLRHFSMLIGFLVLVMFALIGLALHLYADHPPPQNPEFKQQVEARVAPVGAAYAGDTGRAALLAAQDAAKKAAEAQVAYGGTLDGKTIFSNLCQTCHTNAATGAPVLSDKVAWAPRVAEGMDTLFTHAINGFTGAKGMMPAKGGNPSLTDAQVKATVAMDGWSGSNNTRWCDALKRIARGLFGSAQEEPTGGRFRDESMPCRH